MGNGLTMKKKYFDFSRKATKEEKIWHAFDFILSIIFFFPILVDIVKKLF